MKILDYKSKFIVNDEVYLSLARVSQETEIPKWFLSKHEFLIRSYSRAEDFDTKSKHNKYSSFGKTCFKESDLEAVKEVWKEHRKKIDSQESLAGENLFKKYEKLSKDQKKIFDDLKFGGKPKC